MGRRLAILVVLLGTTAMAADEHVVYESFESRQPLFQPGAADAAYQEVAHQLATQTAHHGAQSEYVRVQASQGSHIFYTFALGRADITGDLKASLWVKANRPGMQLLARVVLPRERRRDDLNQPLTTLLRGDRYLTPGRWQQLTIANPVKALHDQQRLLNDEQGRSVDLQGAYIDQIVMNVYGGPGINEVWLDELEVSPVLTKAARPSAPALTTGRSATTAEPASVRRAVVKLNQDRLLVNEVPFFVRGIRYTGTSLKSLREAGFNTLFLDARTPKAAIDEAVNLGFWLVPELHAAAASRSTKDDAAALVSRAVREFPAQDAVLGWHLGAGFTSEQSDQVGLTAQAVRSADPAPGRPVAGGLWDGFRPYSRQLELLGVHRWPLFTGLELKQYREWLAQRGRLAEPGVYLWTWVQTHPPEWYAPLVSRRGGDPEPELPLGPQPDQLRLLTYLTLSAGYRGVSAWSDRHLAEGPLAKSRWHTMALLNQELKLLEPMLATVHKWEWQDIHIDRRKIHPEIKMAVMRYDGGLVVMPMWLGRGAQHVVNQLAANNVEIIIPGAAYDAQVWLVNPVEVRALRHERAPGGVRVVIPEFGLTALLVVTNDPAQVGKLQQQIAQTAKRSAQWAYELALEELKQVELIHGQIEVKGHPEPSAGKCLHDAKARLQLASQAWDRGSVTDFPVVYQEAERARRSLRVLMWRDWKRAVDGLDQPVSSPYALTFYTLPRHWDFYNEVRQSQVIADALAEGNFERPPDQPMPGWVVHQTTLDDVDLWLGRVSEQPKEGKQCLKLQIKAKDPAHAPEALERTFLAVTTPTLSLKPGLIVCVSGWLHVPQPIQASTDGVLFFDSIGGEPLAIRLTGKTPWQRFSLYRRVPESGQVNVTVALTGLGTVYVDDLRVEPLYPHAPAGTSAKEDRPKDETTPPKPEPGRVTSNPKPGP